jgi:ectoine hydroxylase-related dioxygenase (phytanoyl-CoA dioxygenase family)
MSIMGYDSGVSSTIEQSGMDLDRHYPLTDEQIRCFRENGFVKLKDVLSPEVLRYYGEKITQQVLRLNTQSKPMEQRNTYQRAFLQVMNLWTKSETVRAFVFGKKLARIAAELMGVRGVRMYHDQALYKEPGGGFTPWHADQYYWPVDTDNTVTAWIPLQATPMEMGPLAFSATSHKHAVGRNLEISDDSEVKIGKALLEKGLPLVNEPFELGEVSFHYGWTFHRAGANTTSEPRRVMTIIYIEDGCRVSAMKNRSQENDLRAWMPGLKVGDLVESAMNPVMYRQGS